MATSGTTSFNLDIDELIQEAYERIGIDGAMYIGLTSLL